MAKIKVKLEAFYGFSCEGHSHGSEETFELEVNEIEFDALQKLGNKEISCEAVVQAIENGETKLQSLHERLEEKFYYMVEEYWLYEAYNECLYESLEEHIEQDINDGLYTPTNSEDFDDDCDDDDCDDDDYLDTYYDWVKEHDHAFVAERVGLDLDAFRDDEVDYTILFY